MIYSAYDGLARCKPMSRKIFPPMSRKICAEEADCIISFLLVVPKTNLEDSGFSPSHGPTFVPVLDGFLTRLSRYCCLPLLPSQLSAHIHHILV